MIESKAGQPRFAKWFPSITQNEGQEKRSSNAGTEFWCMELSQKQTTKAFRDQIEGKSVSIILGSTNCSKLNGIETGDSVVYEGEKYSATVTYDRSNARYTIGLS